MHSLASYFTLLAHRIEPDPSRCQTAKDMPADVRAHLQGHAELVTVEPHTRLAGSYGRDTAVGQIKDVDILVFAHPDWKQQEIPTLLHTLQGALTELPDILDDCGDVTLRAQRRSVNVFLTKHDLSLDIVPVVATSDDVEGKLEVPDREWERWVSTQPLGYAAFLSNLNAEHQRKVVPLIKMVKQWRNVTFKARRPKSYWLESLVVQHIRRGWVKAIGRGYAEVLADLFDSIYGKFDKVQAEPDQTPSIPDAMLGNNVAWNWQRAHFETFMRRLEEARRWAGQAVEEDDKEDAVALWQRVFGADWFPATDEVELEAKRLGQLSETGSLFVTSVGRVMDDPARSHRAVAAPPKRFYGQS